MLDEAGNEYISSRGILKSCDYYSLTPYSSITYMLNYPDIEIINEIIKKNKIPVIYICSIALDNFINIFLPKIDCSFILVSGDCDDEMPQTKFDSYSDFNKFINNPRLVHWYCQNWTGGHYEKVSSIPIGLDYHTMTVSDCWGPIISVEVQEKLIKSIKENALPFWEREIKCYGNFQLTFPKWYKFGYDRLDAYRNIPKNLVNYENLKISREETWRNQVKYAFVISPHGNGLDCHRTWEALILGCIPIVKKSKIDNLYEDLPVLIVNSWKDINEKLLTKTINNFKNKNFNYERLTLKYWIDQIRK